MWKDWVTNMSKIAEITNFSKFYFYKGKRPRRASWSPQISQKWQKVTGIFLAKWKDWVTYVAKTARITNLTKYYLRERKGQEGLRDVRKFRKNRKSNKNFSSYVKRLSNKYGKNSKNNQFHKILHLEREKVKNGVSKSANFAKIAKVTKNEFSFLWEKTAQQIRQK